MPLTIFKALLAQTNLNVVIELLVAQIMLEAMVAVLLLRLFVVKTGIPVATRGLLAVSVTMDFMIVVLILTLFVVKPGLRVAFLQQLAVIGVGILNAVIFPMLFVVNMWKVVAPMEPNVMSNMGNVYKSLTKLIHSWKR